MPMLTALGRAFRRLPLGTRADLSELLDRGCLDPAEIETNLRDLCRLNRLPGGAAASAAAIERLVGSGATARVLDVGTGGADLPLAFSARGWSITGVDTNRDVLRIARRQTAGEARIEILEGDGRALAFPDGSFDVAHCSLVVHHLDQTEAVAMLREMARVTRRGIVINDLRRGVLPLLATAAGVLALGRCRTTWHDGIASARRAYTLRELDGLLRAADLEPRWRSPSWLPRVVTIATPRSTDTGAP